MGEGWGEGECFSKSKVVFARFLKAEQPLKRMFRGVRRGRVAILSAPRKSRRRLRQRLPARGNEPARWLLDKLAMIEVAMGEF
jgi:hypothetical protein